MRNFKTSLFVILLSVFCQGQGFAGTAVRAHLQSYSTTDAWVGVDVSIGDGHLRMDFQGPWSNGSLIYDQESSRVTLLDHLHKTSLDITAENQQGLKLILALGSGTLSRQMAGANPQARQTYELIEQNTQAFFNGSPGLSRKGVRIGVFNCDEFAAHEKGTLERQVWVTNPQAAAMKIEDYNTLRGLAHLVLELGTSLWAQWGANTESFQRALEGTPLPVQAVYFAKGKASSRFKILSIHPQSFKSPTFAAPVGYQSLSFLDLLRQSPK